MDVHFKKKIFDITASPSINISGKNEIRISCEYAHLHSMSSITTKFHEILLSSFIGVVLTNYFSSIFHFGKISNLKRGITPRKKLNPKFPANMRTFITTKFHKNPVSIFFLSEELHWLKKPNRTDRLIDGSKTLYPTQLVVGYKNVLTDCLCLCDERTMLSILKSRLEYFSHYFINKLWF